MSARSRVHGFLHMGIWGAGTGHRKLYQVRAADVLALALVALRSCFSIFDDLKEDEQNAAVGFSNDLSPRNGQLTAALYGKEVVGSLGRAFQATLAIGKKRSLDTTPASSSAMARPAVPSASSSAMTPPRLHRPSMLRSMFRQQRDMLDLRAPAPLTPPGSASACAILLDDVRSRQQQLIGQSCCTDNAPTPAVAPAMEAAAPVAGPAPITPPEILEESQPPRQWNFPGLWAKERMLGDVIPMPPAPPITPPPSPGFGTERLSLRLHRNAPTTTLQSGRIVCLCRLLDE